MASSRRCYEIDERAWEIIKKNVLELAVFFPMIQDQAVYRRQAVMVLEKTKAEIREKVLVDGRTDNTDGTTANN